MLFKQPCKFFYFLFLFLMMVGGGGEKKCLNSELWHACAGPLVSLPTAGTRVVYFPQGHSEQVFAFPFPTLFQFACNGR